MLSETNKQKDKKFDKITDDSKSVELKTGTYFMYCNAGKYVIDCFDTAVRKNALTLVVENSERSWKVMELKSSKSTNLVFRACACACVASENQTATPRTAPSKITIFFLS